MATLVEEFEEVVKQARSGEIKASPTAVVDRRPIGRPRKVHDPVATLVRLERDAHVAFKDKCDREGVSMADKMRELIQDYAGVR